METIEFIAQAPLEHIIRLKLEARTGNPEAIDKLGENVHLSIEIMEGVINKLIEDHERK